MKNPNNKIIFLVILVIITAFSVFFVIALKLWQRTTVEDQQLSREKALNVIAALKPNMTRLQVYQVFIEHKWTSFGEEEDEIRLSTKPQPLATNWIIRLFFENDALVAIKFGSADNISQRPDDAPLDILFNR